MLQHPNQHAYKYLNKIKEQTTGFCVLQEGASVQDSWFDAVFHTHFPDKQVLGTAGGISDTLHSDESGANRQKWNTLELDISFAFLRQKSLCTLSSGPLSIQSKLSVSLPNQPAQEGTAAMETRTCMFVLCNFVCIATIFRSHLPVLWSGRVSVTCQELFHI